MAVTLAEELRQKAAELEEMRRRGQSGFVRPDEGILLAELDAGKGGTMHLTWYTARDRPPGFSARLWTDQGLGPMPVRGVGYTVPFFHMHMFARAVASALDLSIEYQQEQQARRRQGRDR